MIFKPSTGGQSLNLGPVAPAFKMGCDRRPVSSSISAVSCSRVDGFGSFAPTASTAPWKRFISMAKSRLDINTTESGKFASTAAYPLPECRLQAPLHLAMHYPRLLRLRAAESARLALASP